MTATADAPSLQSLPRLPRWAPPAIFGLLTLAMFADMLVFPGGRVVSSPGTDLALHFAASREFGFGELARGNFPLWNPRMFCGYPYFGGFQPALLYPPNWIFLILPLTLAINLSIALHVFLCGCFTYLWVRGLSGNSRLVHPHDIKFRFRATAEEFAPGLMAGVAYMFCARFFMHVYAGHLPHVCLVPWLPVVLLSIDQLTQTGNWKWSLAGAWAAAMMILAGYPQMVYYTGVIMPIYLLWRLVESPLRLRAVAGLAMIAILALGLSAAQLWAGAQAAEESIRQGGTSYEFARTFSFPPENLLTLFAPDALGSLGASADSIGYFGQAYLWETSTFVGAVICVLAVYGAIAGGRAAALPLVIVICTALLGLGANTPLHRFMFDWVPGFSSFRGPSKFFFLTSLFIIVLAAIGLARLLQRQRPPMWIGIAALAFAAMVAAFGGLVRNSGSAGIASTFAHAVRAIAARGLERGDAYVDLAALIDAERLAEMARASARSLWIAAGWFAAAGAALLIARRWRSAVFALPVLALVECFMFARLNRPTTPLAPEMPAEWRAAFAELAEDHRFVRNPSAYEFRGEFSRKLDAWGYDPGVLNRYAELMQISQGLPADGAKWGLSFRREVPAVFRLARIAMVLQRRSDGSGQVFPTVSQPLPRALVVSNAIVLSDRDSIARALCTPTFDPANTVLLESEPSARIAASGTAQVQIEQVDTDTRRVTVDAPASGVLLLTEAYSRHWTARPSSAMPAGQSQYDVIPADYAFIGVPLSAGKHDLILEYRPSGWIVGRWISLGTLLVFVALCCAAWFSRADRPVSGSGPEGISA